MDHPARYALVEIENVHDQALVFEPIHRVLFNLKSDPIQALTRFFGKDVSFKPIKDSTSMIAEVKNACGPDHHFGMIIEDSCQIVSIHHPKFNLPVGTLQEFLDSWLNLVRLPRSITSTEISRG